MFKKFFISFTFALILISCIKVKADVTDFSSNINSATAQFEPNIDWSTKFRFEDVRTKIIQKYPDAKGVLINQPKAGSGNHIALLYLINSSDLINGNIYTCNLKYFDNSKNNLFGVHMSSINNKYFYIDKNGNTLSVSNLNSYNTQLLDNVSITNNNIQYNSILYNNQYDTYVYTLTDTVNIYYNGIKQNLPEFNIGSDRRDNVIGAFEDNLYPTHGGQVFKKGEFYVRITETYNVPEGSENDHLFTLNMSVPTKNVLDLHWNEYFSENQELTPLILAVAYNNVISKNTNAVYNSDGSKKDSSQYVSFNYTFDAEYANQYDYCDITVDDSGAYKKIGFLITDYEFSNAASLSSLTYNPNGILNSLVNYYGSLPKALFGLCYMNFNYISCCSYDPYTYTVYNPLNIYYPDTKFSNGVIAERRNFNNKTDITNDDIVYDPTDTDTITGNEDTPQIIPSDETIKNLYDNSIQNSYNSITNNYYYDNGLTNNILDYYNRFSDGGSQEDIDGALGYVKSTLGSLTHIPLLLGYCFTGFLPVEVLNLLYALLIIFVVFLIIRIIKHLFTH